MFEINWKKLSPESWYYQHGNYVFKKRKVKDYFVYHIWHGEILYFNTSMYFDFIKKAKHIVDYGYPPITF